MAVASGQLPYEYQWPTPFRVRNHSDQGLSGIHLEAAQFVMQAEIRKFASDFEFGFHFPWRVHTNDATLPGSGYDPKANGATLNGLVGPAVQVDLDHIGLMRFALVETLFNDFYPIILEHDQVSLLQDWIRKCYPESPSGYAGPSNPNPNFQGQFLRPVMQEDGSEYTPNSVGTALTGVFTDSDPHWLGGSGIILDIDVGEVMWNPYPLAFHTFIADVHGRASDQFITIAPCFPAFQRTNGSLISINGLEEKWPQDPSPFTTTNTLFFGFDFITDGKVKFDTYGLFPTTLFYMGALNTIFGDEDHIAFSPNQPTFDSVAGSPFNLEHCEVLINPIPLGTGIYRITSRNSRVDKPFTTLESGVASQYPNTTSFAAHREGYEVFNNCFWMTDWAGKNSPNIVGSAAGPSGAILISPFTGRSLWQRNATDDIGGQVWDIGDSELKDVRWWYNAGDNSTRPLLSLNRVGTDQIVRLLGALEEGGVPGGTFSANVAIYSDDLATVTNQMMTLSIPDDPDATAIALQLDNMMWDGTYYWIRGSSTDGFKTWQVNASFTEILRYAEGITMDRAGWISDGLGGPQKFVGFGGSNIIREYEIIDNPDFPDVDSEELAFDLIATKTLNPPTGMATVLDIYQIIEVTGIPEITDGVYALILSRPTLNTSRRLSLVRIEEGVTTWSVVGHEFIIDTKGNAYNPDTVHLMSFWVGVVS